jgi:hypothetical protein
VRQIFGLEYFQLSTSLSATSLSQLHPLATCHTGNWSNHPRKGHV